MKKKKLIPKKVVSKSIQKNADLKREYLELLTACQALRDKHDFVLAECDQLKEQISKLEIEKVTPKASGKPQSMVDIMRQHYLENLRDEMAKAALTGILGQYAKNYDYEILSKDAYKFADAMLKTRLNG